MCYTRNMKVRGFEIAKGWEDRDIHLPTRSTMHAAAYDIESAIDLTVPPFALGQKPTFIPTGLKAYCQPDEYYYIANRSSGSLKGIVMANGIGIIDADYYENPTNDGHFQVIVYNLSDQTLHIKKGQKVAQVIFQKFLIADNDRPGSKRVGGFGSTDAERVFLKRPIRIVYDLDDVLWDLTRPIMKKLNLEHKKQTNFHIQDDPVFIPEEKSQIMREFCDIGNFHKAEFYAGAKDILQVADTDVKVSINSNAYAPEVVEIKKQRLQDFFPNLPMENCRLNLVTPESNRKQIDQDVLAFVDDSPYNIGESNAKFNLMPEKTWNTSPEAVQTACQGSKKFQKSWRSKLPELIWDDLCYVIPVKNLEEANQFIKQTVKIIKGEGDGEK